MARQRDNKGRFVKGAGKVKKAFKLLEIKARRESNASVITGFNAAYALAVHENIEMKWKGLPRKGKKGKGAYWDPQGRGQAKFLEQPARERRKEIGKLIRRAYKNKMPLDKAIKVGALFLQRLSQLLVPVDTSNLKGSAFTEIE